MENENKPKKSKGLIATIIILILVIVGLCVYIAYDKNIIFKSSANVEEKKGKTEKEVKEEQKEEKEENLGPITFDSDKCINDKEATYTIFDSTYAFNATINEDRKSVTFGGSWERFDNANVGTYNYFEYNINNFDKEIADVIIGSFGQDVYYSNIVYLMADGTVEYTPIRIAREKNDFRSYGKIDGVEDIVKIKTAYLKPKNSPVGGGTSIIAQKKDGTFYNLGNLMQQ